MERTLAKLGLVMALCAVLPSPGAGEPSPASTSLDEQVTAGIAAGSTCAAVSQLSRALHLPIVAAVRDGVQVRIPRLRAPRRRILDLVSRQTGCPWMECGPLTVFQAPLPVVPSLGPVATPDEAARYLAKGGFVRDTDAVLQFLNAAGGETLALLRDGQEVSVRDLRAPAREALGWLMGSSGAGPDDGTLAARPVPYYYADRYRQRVAAYAAVPPLSLPAAARAAAVRVPTGIPLSIAQLLRHLGREVPAPLTADPRVAPRQVVVTASPLALAPLLQALAAAHGLALATLAGGVHVGTGFQRYREVHFSLAYTREVEGAREARRVVLYDGGETTAGLPEALVLRVVRGAERRECVLLRADQSPVVGATVQGRRRAPRPRVVRTRPSAPAADGEPLARSTEGG